MKLTRAWHAFIDASGARTTSGGRRLTLGIDQQGRLWLSGEAIGGQDVPIGADTAAWLSGALAAAVQPERDPLRGVADIGAAGPEDQAADVDWDAA